ncbi:hypothetical protein BKA62DRAFT_740056 [Auriculariales sp. MPI-PUGE-AT-0066]|nr:hypothetical protein BKA62DRAFT_740056 [Auriculariales sp. MPI-PUGE-AT-0066]
MSRCAGVRKIIAVLALAAAVTPTRVFSSSVDNSDAAYVLQDHYRGGDFADAFTWETFDDPTHGRVNYVSKDEAYSKNLSYHTSNIFVMRADDIRKVGPDSRGRDSIRISSNKAYGDVSSSRCGTWPAWWTVSKKGPWPTGGEIDIIEGVNNGVENLSSLHSRPGCLLNKTTLMKGTVESTNCDARVSNNQGCGVSYGDRAASFGKPFNDAFAAAAVSPGSDWGLPDARFTLDACSFSSFFDPHKIIWDLTFCGDWGRAAYKSMGCPGSCEDYVDNSPEAFSEAYWLINSFRIYTQIPGTSPSALKINNGPSRL